MPLWTLIVPPTALTMLAAILLAPAGGLITLGGALLLVPAVLAAVHHAEVVAHRLGEPFGTLVLAIAITVIEVALIVSMLVSGGLEATEVPRDTIFATVMIICNGVVGLCLLLGGLRHHEQAFSIRGAGSALACLIAMATLVLVLPAFTTSAPGPYYSLPQVVFASIAALVIWAVFVFAQTIRHRDYFLPVGSPSDETKHAPLPSARRAVGASALLLVCLVAVVGLAKSLAPSIEAAVVAVGAPNSVIGIAIALLVLLPETLAALRAAHANRLQTSLNLALGSALASIGLSIPAVAAASIWLNIPLELGLHPKDMVMLALSFAVGTVTLATGRTTVMQGAVHLTLFATFLFLAFVP